MKKRENFTIDEDVMKDFEKYVASENMSKSATVENLIRDFLNNKKNKSDLIEKEQVDKLNELINQLSEYKNNVAELSYALYEVIDDEVCCELLRERDLFTEVNELHLNLPIDYDYLAYAIENVYVSAVDRLKKKNNSKFLLKDYLSDELSPVDEDYIRNSGVNYNEWVEENEKLGLDINNYKYLINPNVFDRGNIYYFGDKVASKVILNPNIIFDETFGIKVVAERERLYENNNDYLRFHPDFNQFALYYFLKDYKEIDTCEVFEIFENLYYSITETGIEKIPQEVIEYVTQYSPYTTDEIIEKLNDILEEDLDEDDLVEVYKRTKNIDFDSKANLVWNLKEEDTTHEYDGDTLTFKGKVKVTDIVSISDEYCKEVFTKYNSVKIFDSLNGGGVSINATTDIIIATYIYGQGNDEECSFRISDLQEHLNNIGIDKTKGELKHIVSQLVLNDGIHNANGKYTLFGFKKINIKGDEVFVIK